MNAKTRLAWKYIKTLDYYSKQWNQPLGDLICTLIDSMVADHQEQEKDDFIIGIKKLQEKGWLIGNFDDSQLLDIDGEIELDDDIEEEEENTNNISINPILKKWYWIPFRWGSGNLNKDLKFKNFKLAVNDKNNTGFLQLMANIIGAATSINIIFEFIRNIIQLFNICSIK